MPVFVRSTNSFAVMCGRLPAGLVPMTSLSGIFLASAMNSASELTPSFGEQAITRPSYAVKPIGIMSLLTSNGRFSFCAGRIM